MDIEKVKGSVRTVDNSLQIYGTKDIEDHLIKNNLMHLMSAVYELTEELNRRDVLNKQNGYTYDLLNAFKEKYPEFEDEFNKQ